MQAGHQLIEIRRRPGAKSAVVFLHGFTGDSDETWSRFPTLVGTEESLENWDIVSLGYNTSFLPGSRGVWAADPDLPILAGRFQTELNIVPLKQYDNLAVVAHSMGGLVAQRALVDDRRLTERVKHLFLFGVPSAGLQKASLFSGILSSFVGTQIINMAEGGEFVKDLRARWSQLFGADPPFQLFTIAGDRDQFVPPVSSLKPFAPKYQRVVTGDHLSMVKPRDRNADVIRLIVTALTEQAEPEAPRSPLRLAAETGSKAQGVVTVSPAAERVETDEQLVQTALALDRDGKREEAIALLKSKPNLGTDAKGTLAGRLKRRWLQERHDGDARWAWELYREALAVTQSSPESDFRTGQMFYHAINCAFLERVAFDNADRAREMATLALEFAQKGKPDIWSVATQAEAHLYLGNFDKALEKYREASALKAEPWQLVSVGQQAQFVAEKLGDVALQQALKEIFDPRPKRLNRIFVSYSHKDADWLNEFKLIMSPYLTESDDLKLWDDQQIEHGADWLHEIQNAMATAKVAVLLVSAEFLASDFIRTKELPVILGAVDRKEVHLEWLLLNPAGFEVTKLPNYQAAHDVSKSLEELNKVEQRKILLDVARKIKSAVYA